MRAALCAALALAGLTGCAQVAKPPAAPPPAAPAAKSIERLPVLVLSTWQGTAPAGITLEVRGPDAADLRSIEELRDLTRRMTGTSVGLSGVAIAEAFLLPGFFSGSLVAGGLILAPLAVGLNAAENKQQETIVAALKKAHLLDTTRASLAKRLPVQSPAATLSVIVLAYGLVPKYGNARGPLCLSLVADIVVQAGEREIFRDTVYLEPWHRSADAPPPVCATMEAFAAKDGVALHNAVLDYAQVLAAITRHRLSGLPWTP